MGHYVYKYVYNNEIIYIGKNNTDLVSRINQHGRSGDNITEKGWEEINDSDIYYAELANETMADVVESELIAKYKPKYNVAKTSDWSGLNFIEPIWYYFGKKNVNNFTKKTGRPKVKEGEYKTINISVPVDVLKQMEVAKLTYGNNLTAYVNAVIKADLDDNYDKYLQIQELIEEN